MTERVSYSQSDGVARITMDDGKVNVMSEAMLNDLDAAFDQAEADGAIVILESARPGIFSAGFDLKVFATGDAEGGFRMVHAGGELARSRLHPAWLSRTVTIGQMFSGDDALSAGLVDAVINEAALEETVNAAAEALKAIHRPSHAAAKLRIRKATIQVMREAIDAEITLEAYQQRAKGTSSVILPGAS